MKKYICNHFSDECLLSIILNETASQYSERCIKIKSNNFWFYTSSIPDVTTTVCFDCVLNIFKVFTYPKINSINEILNRISYLIFAPVATVLYRDGTETKVFEPENRENCLKTVDCFLMIPVTVILFFSINNHFCIECECCLLGLNKN